MKLLTSKIVTLPKVFFITDKTAIKEIPIGVPFILGDELSEEYIIRILEYEVLYQAAIKTGYPFNFGKILKDNGFLDLEDFYYSHPIYLDLLSDRYGDDFDIDSFEESSLDSLEYSKDKLKDFVRDSSCYVDVNVLKNLHIFPQWLTKIEDAISTNIHQFATYNNNIYNKKLEGMYGGLELSSPNRNLIIIDISGSIPKAVSSTCLTMAKNLVENFYADLLITGSKSTLYLYEEMYKLNIDTIYSENGMDNDQVWFKKLITGDTKQYETVISFGDNHTFRQIWNNIYNKKTINISLEDGKKMCKWKVIKLINFHTSKDSIITGYADCFSPETVEHIIDWVKYMNK